MQSASARVLDRILMCLNCFSVSMLGAKGLPRCEQKPQDDKGDNGGVYAVGNPSQQEHKNQEEREVVVPKCSLASHDFNSLK